MAFEFQTDSEKNMVTLVLDETTSSEERDQVLDELVEVLKNNPHLNLILDVSDFEQHLPDEEKLQWGVSLASIKDHFKSNKTAVITHKAMDGFSLILASAYTKGFKRIAEFGNRKEATLWLSGEIN